MASQVHHFLLSQVLNMPLGEGIEFVNMPLVGDYFREKIFSVGARFHWNGLPKYAIGENLTPGYFVQQFV